MNKLEDHAYFKQLIHEIYQKNERDLFEKYERSLSFQDGMFDRWERAKLLNFGEGSSIYNSALVYGKVDVGSNTWIGPYVILDGSGGLKIGSHCSISAGVHIYTHDTVMKTLSGGKQKIPRTPVTIGDCCYIGAQTVVKAGVTIGSHCLIGANSFINKSIPDKHIAVGTPVRIIGRVIVEKDGEEVKLEYF